MQEDNGSISYRFSWTQPGQGDRSAALQRQADRPLPRQAQESAFRSTRFTVRRRIRILPNRSPSARTTGSYAEVELTVTRLGQAYGEVGLSTTKKYAVKQRLERPGQPSVTNPDTNELEIHHRLECHRQRKRLCRLSDLCAAGGRNGRCLGCACARQGRHLLGKPQSGGLRRKDHRPLSGGGGC